MINISTSISLINANVIMHRNISKNRKNKNVKKNKNVNDKDVNDKDAFLQEMFERAWKQQEQRLSDLEINCCYRHYGMNDYSAKYEYKNGQKAKHISSYDESGDEYFERWDENGNCIQSESRINHRDHSCSRFTFYPNSSQKEFEALDGKVKHFDKNGNEDTKVYYLKKKIAAKRIKEEEKSNVTLEKASKLEKAISVMMVDKPEMTLIEKMLMRKAKKRE